MDQAGQVGEAVLVCHGIVPTYQPAQFRRVYAAYGGIFIALSVLWGWTLDRIPPDRFDLVGTALSIGGAAIMVLAPLAPGGQWREHALTHPVVPAGDARRVAAPSPKS